MSTGIYGTVRSSDVSVNDMDMYYSYSADRNTKNINLLRLNPSDFISEHMLLDDTTLNYNSSGVLIEGLYNLTLPATTFNNVGIYNIYIKPKTFQSKITDCGVLSAAPSVKGIVVALDSVNGLTANNALQGYKIEYVDSTTNLKVRDVVRYVVTSNKVSSVNENVGSTSQVTTRYKYNDNGNLLFLQLTPSSASDVKPNVLPFIGTADQTILISNTKFNPISFEIEMVENTIDTIVDIVGGNQIINTQKGLISNYDKNGNIIKQSDVYVIKEEMSNGTLYEVKENRIDIDTSEDFETITATPIN